MQNMKVFKLLTLHRIAPERLITRRYDWLQSFPFQQFHVLFNSLFKVLFIFPSRYLFAIAYRKTQMINRTGLSPSMMPHSIGLRLTKYAENASSNYNSI
ncbi:hypothetical protein GLOIN_2v1515763, partial [Rhizophagus irregularis DAOM 181602=DAOM 197198]